MKTIHAIPALLALGSLAMLPACDDEDNVGGSITRGEVTIVVDSTFTVTGRSVRAESIDGRDGNLLLGRLAAQGASCRRPHSLFRIPSLWRM